MKDVYLKDVLAKAGPGADHAQPLQGGPPPLQGTAEIPPLQGVLNREGVAALNPKETCT